MENKSRVTRYQDLRSEIEKNEDVIFANPDQVIAYQNSKNNSKQNKSTRQFDITNTSSQDFRSTITIPIQQLVNDDSKSNEIVTKVDKNSKKINIMFYIVLGAASLLALAIILVIIFVFSGVI